MTAPARLVLGGAVVAAAEWIVGTVALVLLGPVRITMFLLVCAAATALVSAVVWRLTSTAGPDGGDDSEGGPPTTGPDSPPPWWPGFERDFWEHVHGRADRTPAGHASRDG
jgi:hypothetical protein